MKKLGYLLFSAGLTAASSTAFANQQDTDITNMMLGSWSCEYQSSSAGLTMISKSITSVTPETIWVHEFAQVEFAPELSDKLVDKSFIEQKLYMELTYSYRWLIKDNRFISTVTDMQLNSVSDERMSQSLGITDGYLIGMTSYADILYASKEKIVWRYEEEEEDSEGVMVTCLRVDDSI